MARLILFMTIGLWQSAALALDVEEYEEVRAIIDEMESEYEYDSHYLTELFARVQLQPKVIEAITRPAERLPWHRYRKIFISESRINEGVLFWRQHQGVLQRAEKQYGVPAAVIVAIIGVETRYGSNIGSFAVLESLATLSLQYPKRSEYFTSELKKFLLLVREEELDPFSVKGSYAGAIGIPQFMPSSYRAYAVDFSGNGKRDLVHDMRDAVGSVANYLHRHKWAKGDPITDGVEDNGVALDRFVTQKLSPTTTIAAMSKAGVRVQGSHDPNTKASLVRFEQDGQRHLYQVAFENFYVITRYNKSPLYAMVVHELSQHIDHRLKHN